MRRQLIPALRMLAILTVITGLAYPLLLTGFGQALFGDKANGSLVEVDGTAVGSSLLGQTFTGEQYFQGRPSAAGILASGSTDDDGSPADPTDLDNAISGGSNLGPTNPELLDGIDTAAAAYREANGLDVDAQVPVDAVTSSASGLDPSISVANARIQAERVARVRGLPIDDVRALIAEHTTDRSLGIFGEPGVDVLDLNLALDRLTTDRS